MRNMIVSLVVAFLFIFLFASVRDAFKDSPRRGGETQPDKTTPVQKEIEQVSVGSEMSGGEDDDYGGRHRKHHRRQHHRHHRKNR